MTEQLVHIVNGKEYLLIEFITTGNKNLDSVVAKINLLDGIEVSFKIHQSLFLATYVIIKALIPTDKLNEYKKLK